MTAIAAITPHISRIEAPDTLRKLHGWLIWRYEHVASEAKLRKVPYYSGGGRRHGVQGRPEDRERLTTFDAARAAASRRGFDGVGLAILPDFGVVALDFDRCVTEAGIAADVEALVAGTYAEYSPSGKGIRAFFVGALDNQKDSGGPFGFESFTSSGFVTFTGNRLELTDLLGSDNTVAPLPGAVIAYHAHRFGQRRSAESSDPLMTYSPPIGLSLSQLREALDVLPLDLDYESSTGPSWLGVGMAVHAETDGSDEGFALWDEWSSASPKYTTSEYGRARWESFGRSDKRAVTARSLVKWANEHGAHINASVATPEDFAAVTEGGKATNFRFEVIPAAEFVKRPSPGWIIKGLLPKAELAVLFGESGSGKTFVALDLAMAIARGESWRGMRTKQGRVVYIAAEGGGGFRNRLSAYAHHHNLPLDDLPMGVIHATPNFLQKADAVDIAKAVLVAGKADVIIVDTFAQVMPGANENAGEDVGAALAHCRGIHRATGALVLLVHHAGKDVTKGARGWSGLRAAADAELEVQRTDKGRLLRVTKLKDGDDSGEWGFDLRKVAIGIDDDGDVVESCVVVDAPVPEPTRVESYKPAGKWEKLVLDAVYEIALGQNSGIEIKAVIDECVRLGPTDVEAWRIRDRAKHAIRTLAKSDNPPFCIDDDCLSIGP